MKMLQLVLFAQEELRNTLAKLALKNFKSRIVMASTLEPLSREELENMITFRWQVASGGGQHPFTPEALDAIFGAAEGMPREANILADNSLLLAFHNDSSTIGADIVEGVARDRRNNLNRKGAAK
jgi:type II secretory pathway predicted ATPase ExeA